MNNGRVLTCVYCGHEYPQIGVDTGPELRQMEVAMRMLPAPDEDKAVIINAIHALLAIRADPVLVEHQAREGKS